MTETVNVVLKFLSPVRATKPAKDVNLVDRHIEAIKGRILEYARRMYDDEREIAKNILDWKKSLLNVFPRKQYNGCDQIAIPNTWILGVLEKRAYAAKVEEVSVAVIQQAVSVRPTLIGLRRNGVPVTETEIVHDTIISNDSSRRRSALKIFEVVNPPCYTEAIYISLHSPKLSKEKILKLLEYGRLGASRGQGCGEFIGFEVGKNAAD